MSNGVETGLRHSARRAFAADAKHLILSIGLIVATATATAVPAMPPSVIVLTGLLLLAFGMYRLRGRVA